MRLGLLLFFLILIGLIASFYSPAITAKIKTITYRETASPYNVEWMGTSILVKYLREKGLNVSIVENNNELLKELSSGGLLLVIAPDKEFSPEITGVINDYVINGTINLAVFDENITSNNLVREYGLKILGKAILDPFNPVKPYYPSGVIVDRFNKTHKFRLNWGSPINITGTTGNVIVFSASTGVLDLNDNGVLDDVVFGMFVTGVIVELNNSHVIVFGDSYFLTNDAFVRNVSVSWILLDYITWLAREKGGKVVIPNQVYKPKPLTLQTPFHISILFLILADYLKKYDQFINQFFETYPYIKLASVLAGFLAFLALLKYLFNLKGLEEYMVSPVKRFRFLIGSVVTGSVTDKNIIGGREKQLIKRYWDTLVDTYKLVKDVDLEKVLMSKNYELLIRYGFTKQELKHVIWLYNVYVKVVKKTFLPLVISWRRTLFKYMSLVESYLNKIGYTMMNKRGYRDVTSIIK